MTHPGIIQISAGLGLDGGGSALNGRLMARAIASYSQEHQLPFSVLHLGNTTDVLEPIPVTHFSGSQRRMAAEIARIQTGRLPGHERPLLVFDFLGPARVQALLPRFVRSPYLVVMLGIEVWRTLGVGRRRALTGAQQRLAISTYTIQRARQHSPWLPSCEVLHLALEPRPPTGTVDQALLDQAGTGFVLIVGRMSAVERYKGHDELINVWSSVVRQYPALKLVIAGSGDDVSRLKALAASHNVTEYVQFVGFVSEATLAGLYARCAVFAMPSRGEGFGLVYLEAMKAGKPCICVRPGSGTEIIIDGVTGRHIDPDYSAQLEEALLMFARDPNLAVQYGQAGRERYDTHFTFEVYQTKLRGYLERALHSAPSSSEVSEDRQ